ncbi:MAG: signal peptidase II [Dehalococcoidia bacterium]
MQKRQDNGPPSKLVTSKITDSVGEDKSKVSPSKYRGRLRLLLIVAALVVTLDQLSKLWINANRSQIELLPGFLDLRYTENTGAILGLFHGHTELFIALGIAGLVIILVFLYYFPPATTLGVLSFALILSGAVGNLIDRIHLRHVIDFINLHVHELFHWPTFNIADAALTVGILMLIYYFYKSGGLKKAYERSRKSQN